MIVTPEIKDFVFNRLKAMYDRPLMWASNTESFVFQLLLLAEFVGFDTEEVQRLQKYILGPHSSVMPTTFTEEIARQAVDDARERIVILKFFLESLNK